MEAHLSDFTRHLADKNRADRTISQYREVVLQLIRFVRRELHEEAFALDAIDKAVVTAFVREGRLGRPVSAATRNGKLAALRAFFGYLVEEGKLSRDPTAAVPRSALPVRSPAYVTEAEFKQLLRAVEATATEHYLRRDLAILTTLFHTGLRLGELLSLKLGQVDFERELFLDVRRKGGDRVNVHFNVEVTIAVRRWLWERRRYRGAEGTVALFLSDRGTQLSRRAVEDLVGRYVEAAELGKHITPHSLRHSTATQLIQRGVPIEVVADVLHHKSLDTTRGYVHLLGEQVHAAVARLAEGAKRPAGSS